MSACPKCESEIGTSAYCVCGWTRKKNQSIPNPAIDAQRIAEAHWRDEQAARDHQSRADAYCASVGLSRRPGETSEQHINRMREWVRAKVRSGVVRIKPDREPGADEDYAYSVANAVAAGKIGPEAR